MMRSGGIHTRALRRTLLAALAVAVLAPSAVNAQEGGHLTYWSMWNETEPQAAVIKEAIAAFEAATGASVDVQWTGREVRNLIGGAIAAGTPIDLFDDSMSAISANQGANVVPLDAYLDTEAIGADGRTVRETIPAALLELFPVDGQPVSLPYQPYAVMFYYSKDQFDSAGITALPTTWQELLDAGAKLKEAGFAPITTDVDSYVDIYLGYHAQRAFGDCSALAAAMTDPTGEAWRDSAWLSMAEDIAALSANGLLADGTAGNLWPAGQQLVALGEVAMELNASWLPSEVGETAGPDFAWGAFPYPAVPDGAGSANDTMLGSQGLAISSASADPDLAFELAKYFVSPAAQEGFVSQAGVPAAHVDVAWPPNLTEAQAAFLQAEDGFGWACDLYDQDIGTQVVLPAFTDLFLGNIEPAAFIDRLVAESAGFWGAAA